MPFEFSRALPVARACRPLSPQFTAPVTHPSAAGWTFSSCILLLPTGSTQGIESLFEPHRDTGENRRVAQRVEAGLRLAQLHDEIQEVCRLVRFERHDELLVVQPKRVRRVQLYGGILAPYSDVLVHHRLTLILRQLVPLARLHERVDKEVFGIGWMQVKALAGFLRAHVDGP